MMTGARPVPVAGLPRTLGSAAGRQGSVSSLGFYLVVLYLFLEYGRPQEIIPGLSVLHMPALVTVVLALSLCFSTRLSLADRETRLFMLLLALMALHVPVALNNYWAFHTAKAMAMTFVAYLAFITFVDSFDRFKRLISLWLAIHVYLALVGIFKTGVGIGGFLGDENEFAMALNMVFPVAFFLALGDKTKTQRALYLGLTALFAFTTGLTFSRAGFLSLTAAGLYSWLLSSKKVVSAMVIALLVVFGGMTAPDRYWDRIRSIQRGAADPNGEDRIYEWKIGWTMFLDNPVVGVGQGNFPFQFRKYEVASGFYYGLHGRSRAGRSSHSLYVDLLAELGLVGAALWSLIFHSFYRSNRSLRQLLQRMRGQPSPRLSSQDLDAAGHLSRALQASAIAYLVSGIFNSVLYYPNFWLLVAFSLALRKIVGNVPGHNGGAVPPPSTRSRAGRRWVLPSAHPATREI